MKKKTTPFIWHGMLILGMAVLLLQNACSILEGPGGTLYLGSTFLPPKLDDYYGKVIDQYGQPVPDVQVTGTILVYQTWAAVGDGPSGGGSGKITKVQTQSDSDGLYQFKGMSGISFGVEVEKRGYEMNLRYDSDVHKFPISGGKSSPVDRNIFTMYKLQGAEWMTHAKFGEWIPYNGTSFGVNLFNGKMSDAGDLKVTLVRNPLNIVRGRDHFDWNVKIEVIDGGLTEIHDQYPYLASVEGYKTAFEFSASKDDPHWTQKLVKDFYVHTSKNTYGRIHFDLTTDSDRPDGTGLGVEAFMNSNPGSRNLEFDRAKEIKVK